MLLSKLVNIIQKIDIKLLANKATSLRLEIAYNILLSIAIAINKIGVDTKYPSINWKIYRNYQPTSYQ